MGSFNVACSISNLSINCGEPVYFLPLIRNGYKYRNTRFFKNFNELEPASWLIYANCIFDPFCLPIKGVYNDYGSLELIETDPNVKMLEGYFGLSIEDFIGAVGCGRHISSSCNPIASNYVIDPKHTLGYSTKINKTLLQKYGFKHYRPYFVHPKFPKYRIRLLTDDPKKKFEIYKGNKKVTQETPQSSVEDFVTSFEKLTGYLICVKEKLQDKVHLLSNLSGMFIHGDVYDELASGPKSVADNSIQFEALKKLGFKLRENKEGRRGSCFVKDDHPLRLYADEEYYSSLIKEENIGKKDYYDSMVCSLTGLKQAWLDHTGEELDISKWSKKPQHQQEYEDFRKQLIEADKLKAQGDDLEYLLAAKYSDFKSYYRDWPFFDEFYLDLIKKNKLKKEFVKWVAFSKAAFLANRFWFPAMNGEQFGNAEATQRLLDVTAKVNKRKLEKDKKYEEEDIKNGIRSYYG